MYNREKRRFTKLILDKYKELNRVKNPGRYSEEYRRIRDYAEVLFLALRLKRAPLVTANDIVRAVFSLCKSSSNHQSQLMYVARLAIAQIENLPPVEFDGAFNCPLCSGIYRKVNINGSSEAYVCSGCGYKGSVDQHGFPNSMPAERPTLRLREQFHRLIREARNYRVYEEEFYQLVAFEMNVPLPLVHAGLCTSEFQMREMVFAARKVLTKVVPSEMAA
ncbi:hypothetical protein ACPV5U_19065 [Vibrio mediterranei]|jgi:predicted RNA-binding Zn-ribbon protein involved in translation (DUF1610 family)